MPQVGVDIISDYGVFASPNEVELRDGRRLRFRKCAVLRKETVREFASVRHYRHGRRCADP